MASFSDIDGKLQQANLHKEKGNEFFKEGIRLASQKDDNSTKRFRKAKIEYAKVFAFTSGLPGSKRGLDGVSSMAAGRDPDASITSEQEAIAVDLEVTTRFDDCMLVTNCDLIYFQKGEHGRLPHQDESAARRLGASE